MVLPREMLHLQEKTTHEKNPKIVIKTAET